MMRSSLSVAVLALLLTLPSCGGRTQEDCDAIAEDIRDMAAARGIPPQGVCSSTSEAVRLDFGARCKELRECNAEVD